jgi:DNA-binding GntR family transcriptional regulator
LHRIISEAAGGQKLNRLLPQLIEMPLVLDTYNRFTDDDMNRSMRHHRELVVAFTAQDADWADAIMRGHIQSARNCYLQSFTERAAKSNGAAAKGR